MFSPDVAQIIPEYFSPHMKALVPPYKMEELIILTQIKSSGSI